MTRRHDSTGDPVVRSALASLEAPEHRPGFWDDLDASLADASPPAPPPLAAVPDLPPSTVVDEGDPLVVTLDDAPPSTSRRSRSWRWLPAAAAVALVAAVGAQMLSERDQSGPTLGTDGSTLVAPSTTDAPATTPTTAPPPSNDLAAAQATVLEFVDALGRGDLDAAAAQLGPRSEEFLDGLGQPPEQYLGTVAGEGHGAWGRSTDREAYTIDVAPGSAVVVLQGTLELEGTTETRADAFAVQRSESADTWFVDRWAYPQLEADPLNALLDLRLDGTTLSAQNPVSFPTASPGTAYFALGSKVVAQVHSDEQGTVTWVPGSELAAGQYTLTVAFVADDGSIFSAMAIPAQVSG